MGAMQVLHVALHSDAPTPLTPAQAWDLTARLSPRPTVRAAQVDHAGRAQNSYPVMVPTAHPAPDRPWAVNLADTNGLFHLLGLDFDAKGNPSAAARDADHAADELRAVGLRPVVCASGPGGGRHVWAALATPVDAGTMRQLAVTLRVTWRTLDITQLTNAATGCLRPPGSPHRNGGASTVLHGDLAELLTPRGGPANIDALAERLAPPAPEIPAMSVPAEQREHSPLPHDPAGLPHLAGARRPLSTAGHAALTSPLAPGADASAVLWSVMLHAAASRWRYEDLRRHSGAPGLEHARTQPNGAGGRTPRTARATEGILRGQWRKAVDHVSNRSGRGHDPTYAPRCETVVAAVEAVQRRADASPGRWGTGHGPTTRRTLDALCVLALTGVTVDVDADTRRLAQLAGIGRTTVATALHRLADEGWIVRTRAAAGRHGASWSITPEVAVHRDVVNTRSQAVPPRGSAVGPAARNSLLTLLSARLADSAHDAFTPHALGAAAGNLWAHTSTTPRGTADLARSSGIDPADAERQVHQLAAAGLLQATQTGWTRPPQDLRESVAHLHGTHGTLALRAAAYEVERIVWAWWCSEVEWLRARGHDRRSRPALHTTPLPGLAEILTAAPRYPRTATGRGDHDLARDVVVSA